MLWRENKIMQIRNLSEKTEDFTGNIWLMQNGETVLIDVGRGDSWQAIQELEEVDKVVITHSHYDHVDNLPKVEDAYHPEIYAFDPENLTVKAEKLKEGEEIVLCGTSLQVFHTPGHKDDSICLYSRKDKILFTGDLVFPEGGFGRTDLEEGDRDQLIDSIEKLVDLEVNEMYCGHEPATKEDVEEQIENSLQEAKKRKPKY
ncbi:MAG: hydroxyacylglutathione hydrolase [Candidatus Nanohaloarchaea archaeon]|jgi:hydroxyacylglutathione hydrolase